MAGQCLWAAKESYPIGLETLIKRKHFFFQQCQQTHHREGSNEPSLDHMSKPTTVIVTRAKEKFLTEWCVSQTQPICGESAGRRCNRQSALK